MVTTDLREQVAARLDELLTQLGELVDPARELAPVPGDVHGPIGWPADKPPQGWPEGLPWPLSARQALDAVQVGRELLGELVAGDIAAAVAALVEPDAQAAVLAAPELVSGWRLPLVNATIGNGAEWYGPSYGPRLALERLVRACAADLDPVNVTRADRLADDFRDGMAMFATIHARSKGGQLADRDVQAVAVEATAAVGAVIAKAAADHGITLQAEPLPPTPALEASGMANMGLLYRIVRNLPRNLVARALAAVQSWVGIAPGDLHNVAARGALDAEGGPREAVPVLARELWQCAPDLVRAIGEPEGLAIDQVPELDGMLALDADLADWLAQLDQSEGDKVRTAARERLARYHAGKLDAAGLFARWLDGRTLRAVARALWLVRSSTGLRVRGVRYGEDVYTTAPRLLAPMAWALGGAGKAAAIDGDAYREAPAVARYLPRAATLRDLSKRPPAQRALPVEVDAPAEVQVIADAQYVVSPATAKVALAMLTLAPPKGELVRGTLDELCELVKPGARIQKRDRVRAAEGLRALRSLALVLADGTSVTLFNDIRGPADPELAKPDHLVEWSLSRVAVETTTKGEGDWPGRFLYNFSGAMRLSAETESAHLRAYLTIAALWNGARPGGAGELDPERVPKLGAEGWADRFNMLSPTALESKSPAHRVKLSETRAKTLQTLEELYEKHGLLILEKIGKDSWRPLPTPALLEAYRMMRKQGARLL